MRTIDLGGYISSDLRDVFDDFNIEYEDYGIGGHLSFDDFIKAATEDHDAFIKALEEIGEEDAQTLIDIINNHEELVTNYTDSKSQEIEARRDKTAQENSINISSYEDYLNLKEMLSTLKKLLYQVKLQQILAKI